MPTPQDPDFEQRVRKSFAQQQFMTFLGAELTKVEAGFCEITLPYRPELSQQNGFFHAGVIGTLADNAGGYAAYSLMAANAAVLTVEFKINLMSPGDGEKLIARSGVVKKGKTLTICQPEVFVVKNGVEKKCALVQMTIIELAQS